MPAIPLDALLPTQILRQTRATAILSRFPACPPDAPGGRRVGQKQLATPYRDGGWTVRQVVHHVPDSHLNAYIRFKWAMTEEAPTIKAYDEGAWAALKDSELTPWMCHLRCLNLCMRAGRCCCGRSSQKTFSAGSFILTLARTILTGCWDFIAGTATTMWRTSPACVNGWAGNLAADFADSRRSKKNQPRIFANQRESKRFRNWVIWD